MKNENLVTTIQIKDEHGNVVSTREVVTYAGLLNRAHQEGLKKIETKVLQTPSADNDMTAISMAQVETDKGTFCDCGDANPNNVNSSAIPHIIRVSLTRAKVRALRDAVNVGTLSLEELAEDYQDAAGPGEDPDFPDESLSDPSDPEKPMTDSQKRYLYKLLGERGMNQDQARHHLRETLKVSALSEITRKMASDEIQKLLSERPSTQKTTGQ